MRFPNRTLSKTTHVNSVLHNRPGSGTEAINLENCSDKGEALQGWIADFGIGSAIFDSGLLPDEMEDTAECQV